MQLAAQAFSSPSFQHADRTQQPTRNHGLLSCHFLSPSLGAFYHEPAFYVSKILIFKKKKKKKKHSFLLSLGWESHLAFPWVCGLTPPAPQPPPCLSLQTLLGSLPLFHHQPILPDTTNVTSVTNQRRLCSRQSMTNEPRCRVMFDGG